MPEKRDTLAIESLSGRALVFGIRGDAGDRDHLLHFRWNVHSHKFTKNICHEIFDSSGCFQVGWQARAAIQHRKEEAEERKK